MMYLCLTLKKCEIHLVMLIDDDFDSILSLLKLKGTPQYKMLHFINRLVSCFTYGLIDLCYSFSTLETMM